MTVGTETWRCASILAVNCGGGGGGSDDDEATALRYIWSRETRDGLRRSLPA